MQGWNCKYKCGVKVLLALLFTVVGLPHGVDAAVVPTLTQSDAQLLGQPCRVVNAIGDKLLFTPPGFDHQVLAINSDTPGAQGSAIFVDYQRGKSTVVPLPGTSGGWDIIEVAPGKLLFESISKPLQLITIDTTGGNYRVESTVTVPGNEYAWQFAKGPDGNIYLGSYPSSHLYRYNPASKQVEDLGKVGSEKNLYLRFLAFDAKSGLLLCVSGMTQSQIVAYDIKTGHQTVIADQYPIEMHSVYGRVYAAIAKKIYVFDSDQMKMVPLTHPAPPVGQNWESMARTAMPERLLLRTSSQQWYEISAHGKCRKVWEQDLRGGGLVTIDANGHVLGLRGQEYFVAKPLSGTMEWKAIARNPSPVAIHFITADPQGGVTGGPSFGQTLFRFDPARQLAQNTGQVADGGGEVYTGLWRDGKFYYAAYSGGYLGIWDPAKPWDQFHNNNPQVVEKYAKQGLIRPIGGMVEGPAGRLYIGWSASYGKIGGGLTEFDPATGKSRVWDNQRFAPQMSIGRIAADDRYVYGFTSNAFNGVNPPNKAVRFWVFDPHSEKVLFTQEMNGVVFKMPTSSHIWVANAQGLQRFDPDTMTFVKSLSWPPGTTIKRGISSTTARGNTAWIAVDDTIMQLKEDAQATVTAILQCQSRPLLAAGADGKLYFTQQDQLWALPLP